MPRSRSPFADWLVNYNTEMARGYRRFRRYFLRTVHFQAASKNPDLVLAIKSQQWERLARFARRLIATTRRHNTRHMRYQQEAVQFIRNLKFAHTAILQLAPPRMSAIDPGFRTAVQSGLSSRGLSRKDTQNLLARLDQIDPKQYYQTIDSLLTDWTRCINELAEVNGTIQMSAILGLAVAAFNKAAKASQTLRSSASNFVEDAWSSLDKIETDILRTLHQRDAFCVWGLACELRVRATRDLFLGGIQHAATLANQRRTKPDDAELGRTAVRMGNLIRRQLRAIAFSHALEWTTRWGDKSQEFLRYANAAQKFRSLSSAVRWPRAVHLRSLLLRGRRYEGKAWSIEGRVDSLLVQHRAGKPVSTIHIVRDKTSVPVVLGYIKPDSSGLVPGSWCRLAGVWRHDSKHCDTPALELHRLPLAELAQTSWVEYVTHDIAHRLAVTPHSLAAEWSWETGPNGAGNPLRYGVSFVPKGK